MIIPILVFIVVFILVFVYLFIRKIVVGVPSVSVTVEDKAYYRSDVVSIVGQVKIEEGVVPGQAVVLELMEPNGVVTGLGTVTTDGDGKFSHAYTIPSNALLGTYTVTASALSKSATATFIGVKR